MQFTNQDKGGGRIPIRTISTAISLVTSIQKWNKYIGIHGGFFCSVLEWSGRSVKECQLQSEPFNFRTNLDHSKSQHVRYLSPTVFLCLYLMQTVFLYSSWFWLEDWVLWRCSWEKRQRCLACACRNRYRRSPTLSSKCRNLSAADWSLLARWRNLPEEPLAELGVRERSLDVGYVQNLEKHDKN